MPGPIILSPKEAVIIRTTVPPRAVELALAPLKAGCRKDSIQIASGNRFCNVGLLAKDADIYTIQTSVKIAHDDHHVTSKIAHEVANAIGRPMKNSDWTEASPEHYLSDYSEHVSKFGLPQYYHRKDPAIQSYVYAGSGDNNVGFASKKYLA